MKFRAIKENHLYQKAYHNGRKCQTGTVVVYVLRDRHAKRLQNENPQKTFVNRIGLTVTKRQGGAVVRNRIKRRLRAACAPLLPQMKPGLYVFIARQGAITADFDKLCRSMQYLLRKQNRLITGPKKSQDENPADDKKAGDPA